MWVSATNLVEVKEGVCPIPEGIHAQVTYESISEGESVSGMFVMPSSLFNDDELEPRLHPFVTNTY